MARLLCQMTLIADSILGTAVRTFATGDAQASVNLRLAFLYAYGAHRAALHAFGAAHAGALTHLHVEGTGDEAPQKVE